MRVRLLCEGVDAEVTPFVGRFVGNVCVAIPAALKAPVPAKMVLYRMSGEEVRLEIDGAPVPLDLSQGFAVTLIRDTLRGMIQHLRGLDPQRTIGIIVELEDAS